MPSDKNEVAVFWDFGSCPAPNNRIGYTVVRNIRSLALRFGNVISFKAYLSVSDHGFPVPNYKAHLLRSQLQSSGVSLTDVPGKKDVADKMLIVDMLAYAFDRPSASTVVVLISADPTLAYALSILRFRSHHVVVVSPSETRPDLGAQASLYFDWNEIIGDRDSPVSVTTEGQGPTSKESSDSPVVDDTSTPQPRPRSPRPRTKVKLPKSNTAGALEDYSPAQPNFNAPPTPKLLDPEIKYPAHQRERIILEPELVSISTASDTFQTQLSAQTPAADSIIIPPSIGGVLQPEPELESGDTAASAIASTNGSKGEATTLSGEEPPSYSSTPPPPRPTPKKKGELLPGFIPLVEILHSFRAQGVTRPRRSVVGLQLIQKDRKVYEKAGAARFTQYVDMAVNLGLVKLGGESGGAWISLLDPTQQG